MAEKHPGSPSASHLSILSYWHKIEFFIPYDLQRQVLEGKGAEWNVRVLSAAQLEQLTTEDLWSAPIPEGRRLRGFDLYLGAFDKSGLAEVTRRVVKETLNENEAWDQEERGELEGLTCCASIRVASDGTLLLDDLAVSTVPWALGRIAQRGLGGLDFDDFRADLESLKRDVKTFRASRGAGSASADADSAPASPADLRALLDILSAWSGYEPAGHDSDLPVVVLRAKSVEDKVRATGDAAKDPGAVPGPEEDDDDDGEPLGDTEISILNSFYAEDIARVIASIEQGTASAALRAYLTPLPEAARVDLYKPQGRNTLAERLRPKHLNGGHWPGNPAHAMSLMQQFAVNSIFEQQDGASIFSVNGPPGTGKTTLLRDIFAENIVRRAWALARCATAGDAFQPDRLQVSFAGEKDCAIAVLRDELVGFEMVVASSNNAAVENISRDLPKNKSLGKPPKPGEVGWREATGQATFSYLQPVVRNLVERTAKGTYERPSLEDDTWGLISCALGKKRNRDAFVRGISFAGSKAPDKPPKGFDPARHQSLWHWRNKYSGISFAQAKRAFSEADAAVGQLVTKLDRFAKLYREFKGVSLVAFSAVTASDLTAAEQAHRDAQKEFADLDEALDLAKGQVELLQAEEAVIKKGRPGWWARLTDNAINQAYQKSLAKNLLEQASWIRTRYEAEPPRAAAKRLLDRAAGNVTKAQAAHKTRQQEWSTKLQQLEALSAEFPQAGHPQSLSDLDTDDWQIHGVWRSDLLNEKRSALFVAALQLHEAWLAEVLQSGAGFGANIVALCHLLDGKKLQNPQSALSLWRSLLMLVPVVSSTFASFARQFRHLGPASLGWLFVDEAGQAVPQAAVGALWRARRAVVVGDPLQIEPVFTVPIKLLEALSKTSSLPAGMDVSPHKVSVQTLADSANSLGALVGANGQSQWIGSPLRVHRRCVDPMFSVANEIAYEGKMIFFAPQDPLARHPPADSLDMGASAWVHAPGPASDKQVVRSQVDLVQHALFALYVRTGKLPPIYIISPFKRIKGALLDRLSKRELWAQAVGRTVQPPKTNELREWCKDHVGTVHTFQGKEESIVWLVLGCDQRTVGAAHWASSKPNLLNVAVTRAQHRCFLIGDEVVWGGLRNFTAAHEGRMPRITPQQFVDRALQ